MNYLESDAVIVTGAGGGLGAAYAQGIAAAGAGVIVNDIDAESAEAVAAQIRADGGRAVAEPQDIRFPAGAQALADRCIAEFGFVSGLVNNAGVLAFEPFVDATLENLQSMLDVNVVGVFNCARAVVGPMRSRRKGSIVNVASGSQAGQVDLSSYGASKGAVASFTYGWAAELHEFGIRVNAISPIAATKMSAPSPGYHPPPAANAPVVVYLLSELSRDITGQVVRINAGKLSLMTHPANRQPILERDTWSVQAIADVFDSQLSDLQLPTGIANYEIVNVHANAGKVLS